MKTDPRWIRALLARVDAGTSIGGTNLKCMAQAREHFRDFLTVTERLEPWPWDVSVSCIEAGRIQLMMRSGPRWVCLKFGTSSLVSAAQGEEFPHCKPEVRHYTFGTGYRNGYVGPARNVEAFLMRHNRWDVDFKGLPVSEIASRIMA